MRKPTEAEVQKVMQETGMQYLQAYRHLEQRFQLQDKLRRGGVRTLGKSCYDPA